MFKEDNYRPLPLEVEIRKSTIEGYGLFAKYLISSGKNLGCTHIYNTDFQDNRIRTPLGGFINHSEEPNCEVREDVDGNLMLFTLRPILPNEELTLKYNLYKVH